MTHYYNENNAHAAKWLKNLMAVGAIPTGEVDERSITEVRATELQQYRQVHMFAGIAGWAEALRLAGWPQDRPVWTGSPPCQPFSVAGAGKGKSDERHLWPVWFNLIKKCHPRVIFGEQVAAAINYGWLDALCDDLESEGYTCAAAILPACGLGAPHLRQRLWFVAYACGEGSSELNGGWEQHQGFGTTDVVGVEPDTRLGNTHHEGPRGFSRESPEKTWEDRTDPVGLSSAIGITGNHFEQSSLLQQRKDNSAQGQPGKPDDCSHMAHADGNGCDDENRKDAPQQNSIRAQNGLSLHSSSELWATRGFWGDADWLYCRDHKFRAIEPGTLPLVNGVQGRVELVRTINHTGKEVRESHGYSRAGAIKGYGNAIVPQVAAQVIKTFMDLERDGLL